jgi:hypothetical protein
MINLSRIINSPLLAQTYTVYHNTGQWSDDGEWTPDPNPTPITYWGPVIAANSKDVLQVPEGDRVEGMMVFYSDVSQPLLTSHSDPGTADQLVWNGDTYRVWQDFTYLSYGYYKACGVRMAGA